MENLLKAEEVAALLNVSERKVYDLKDSGALKHVLTGKSIRFRPCDVKEYVESNIRIGREATT